MNSAEPVGRGAAAARAALAGNPSDGYGGAVLAVTVPAFRAEAVARRHAAGAVQPDNLLVAATIRRFARELAADAQATSVTWRTTIPRGVGLGGSSAVVIATTRALCQLYGLRLTADEVAAFALAVETEELGIAAGLQDRVAQSYGGLTFMEFATGSYESLDPTRLPPLLIAWRTHASADSGPVHERLRDRFEQREPIVRQAMAELAEAARAARAAIVDGDVTRLARCVDASFDARQRMLRLDPRHVEMVSIARAAGAAANYTGSGGAIVAVCTGNRHRATVTETLRRSCGVVAV